ncbi:MAG: nucleotidyltransferase domain-containing protein [Nanoarchaeota archaeon]|nr:nucleotidyltransferase domain-containing protein [Nanoarchaeota archaeon]
MIKELIPLTKNKIEILKIIYDNEESYLLEIAKKLKLHPYSVQKTLSKLKLFLKEKKAGRTILLSIDKTKKQSSELIKIIEDYKLSTKNKKINSIISHLTNLFLDKNILTCVLFGSYARLSFTTESDIDILLIVKKKNVKIKNKISQLSTILGKEVNPLILSEKEFMLALTKKEPSIMSLKKPSQRLIIKGVNYFLEKIIET